ncbi:uncharacterized protein LOC126837686 [Adelges cooleyi]|uniref:uncharacterized protein LOC126837686 n=1 Tax=Adelges cooleyi TaxID=133065 RepID=UPI0021808B7C|nr:uncharacterized protein LOC126837686 [Adelges cooleyi]
MRRGSMFVHYVSLMQLDTGYSIEEKPKVSREDAYEYPAKVQQAINEIYNQVLCCYIFDMLSYMDLLGQLFSENSENELAEVSNLQENKVVFLSDNIIDMMNVLYSFGKLDDMDPLWTVYMFVKYLRSIEKNEILARRENIQNEHHNVYQRLAHKLNKQKCKKQNEYNAQYSNSEFYNRFQSLDLNQQHKIVALIAILKQSIYKRYQKVEEHIHIDTSCRFYFSATHLKLESVWHSKEIVRHLFVDFAEVPECKRKYSQIQKYHFERPQFDSLQDLIESVAKSQSLFVNLVKFIFLHSFWKQLTLINLALLLSDNEEQPHRLRLEMMNQEKINDLNKFFYRYVKLSTDYFSIKDDLGLIFLKYLVKMPANLFTNVQFNKTVKKYLLKYMDEIYSQVFGCETKLVRYSGIISSRYIINRQAIFAEVCQKHNMMDIMPSIKELTRYNISESNLSIHIFYKLIIDIDFECNCQIDFDVIRSFNNFSDEFLGTTSY